MYLDDLVLVSVDDHVVEPPDVFHNQLTKDELERAPKVVRLPNVLDDDTLDRITHRNAMRHFQYDPFAHFPLEQCTVGALRARAIHVDVAERSMTRRELSGDRSSTGMTDLFAEGARAG